MNDKKRILILLKILDKIQEDIEDARKKTEKPITAMQKEEAISFEQVFYILFSDALTFEYKICSRSTNNSLNYLFATICNDM